MRRLTTQTFLLLPVLMFVILVSTNFSGCVVAEPPTSATGATPQNGNGVGSIEIKEDNQGTDGNGNPGGTPGTGPCAAPILSYVFNSDTSITIEVKAPASGLPDRFTIYWVSTDDYENSGWHACDDNSFCKVPFTREVANWTGIFSGAQFSLDPDETINVQIGRIVKAGGITGPGCLALACGKSYKIKAINPVCPDLESELIASTRDCDPGNQGDHCTYSQGYWKNHTPWPAPHSPNDQWFNSGTATWMSMISDPPQGDKYKILAKQYIAAILNGANNSPTNYTVTLANNTQITIAQILVNSTNYYSGQGALSEALAEEYASFLEEYNTGVIGPGHCD